MSYAMPDKNENYKEVEYWNDRYTTEESYEWCKDYSAVRHIFSANINKDMKILVIGCGNSNLSLDLHKDGYEFITNIDYSQVVIEKMTEKHGHLMNYQVMDMRHLEFPSKFDVVIEKSTLDVLFTTEKSVWTLSPETQKDIELTLSSIRRVLNDNGLFISITFAEPYFRKQLYSKYWENLSVQTFGDSFHYYFYICKSPHGELMP